MARRVALVALALASSCFRGDFLEGTSCSDDRQCAPRFVCITDTGTTSGSSSGGGQGVCGPPDYSPPPGTSSETGTTGATGSTSGATGSTSESTG